MTELCKLASESIALEGGPPSDDNLREHAERCPECSRLLSSVLSLEKELGWLDTPDVSSSVVDALLARKELRQPRRSRDSRYGALALAAAAIVAMVSVAVTRHAMEDGGSYMAVDLSSSPEEPTRVGPRPADQIGPPPPPSVPPTSVSGNSELEVDAPAALGSAATTAKEEPAFEEGEAKRDGGRAVDELRVENRDQDSEKKGKLRQDDEEVVVRRMPLEMFLRSEKVSALPQKTLDVAPEYPESARRAGIEGTVELFITIDPRGNVVDARVIRAVNGLDEAALEAVQQWKFVPAEGNELRYHLVSVPFELDEPEPEPEESAAALSFLNERANVENLHFREASGYWANTYLPGDPAIRMLERRLEASAGLDAPHAIARAVRQPFDAPPRGALSLFVHADRRGLSETSRLLVQVGLQATEQHGRRRPPMNLAVVLDLSSDHLATGRALVEALHELKEAGDRFRLIRTGLGEVVAPEDFRYGALRLALDEPAPPSDVASSLRLALEHVHAGDDPSAPLGTSLVLLVTDRPLRDELGALGDLVHSSAVGGVSVSAIGVGAAVDTSALDRLAFLGQGRRYFLGRASDSGSVVDRELSAASRVVARAVRLRIKLAPGVKLVDVVGSEPLNERQADRIREAERAIDLRIARNLGIEADRGEDEDGIQIVIPSFYASDSHVILLDVVAEGPGPIAEVTARYKDLAELENRVARASLALPRSSAPAAPLELNVLENFLAARLGSTLEGAADRLQERRTGEAIAMLRDMRELLSGLRAFRHDGDVARDIAMLRSYEERLTTAPDLADHWADSLRYASALKRGWSAPA